MIKNPKIQKRLRELPYKLVRAVLIIGICFIILFPMFVKLSVSFMDESDVYDPMVMYIPGTFTLNNYVMAIDGLRYLQSLMNTIMLSLSTSLLTLTSCSLVAYGFARFRFPFKRFLFFMVVLMIVVPPQTIMLSQYMFFRYFNPGGFMPSSINLLNTFWPFVIMSATVTGLKNGLFVYIFAPAF